MDLLQHYGGDSDSSSSSSGGDDSDDVCGANINHSLAMTTSASTSSACVNTGCRDNNMTTGRRKRPRPASTSKDSSPVPQQRQAPPSFLRTTPHTPGNWAGHVFVPLVAAAASDNHSGSMRSAQCGKSKYDGINRAAGRQLCDVAQSVIEEFTTILEERTNRTRKGGEPAVAATNLVVSHLPIQVGDDEDNGTDDDDDDASSGSDNNSDEGSSSSSESSEDAKIKTVKSHNQTTIANPTSSSSECSNQDAHIPLHISLSQPFYLQVQSIPSFVEQLTKVVEHYPPIPIALDPNQPQVLVNDEGTRSFLTIPASASTMGGPMRASKENSAIVKLIRSIDGVMARFGQPTYYDDPKIHVSVASVPGDIRPVLVGTYGIDLSVGVPSGDDKRDRALVGVTGSTSRRPFITLLVDSISCTFGTTKSYCIRLNCAGR